MANCVSPSTAAPAAEHGEQLPAPEEEKQQQQHQPAIARQSSLMSLTLDEIQNSVCEPGKTFGSMNMDEFLTNIWTAEEGTAMTSARDPVPPPPAEPPQPLRRQGSSVSLPPALCRKTVEEVWSEIQRDQGQQHPHPHHPPHNHHLPQQQQQQQQQQQCPASSAGVMGVPRQPTLGEMTLEDFLIKAGVVREGGGGGGATAACPISFSIPATQQPPPEQLQTQAPYNGGYGAMMGTPAGYGEHRHNSFLPRVGSPSSPVSSDGFSGATGRKRAPDGSVDRVLERRQRRMIKNRESAARSRARKQAYTVELETELNQLKEENARLQEEQRRIAARRRQMALEAMVERAAQAKPRKRNSKPLRHCSSCLW